MEPTITALNKVSGFDVQKLISSGEVVESNSTYLVIEKEDIPMRKLGNGDYVHELEEPHQLNVITKCPTKWILQDLETGQVYRGTDNTEVGKQWKEIKQEKQPQKR